MNRKSAVLAATALATSVSVVVSAAPANATTSAQPKIRHQHFRVTRTAPIMHPATQMQRATTISNGGIRVSITSSITTYNRARGKIAPRTHVNSGVHKVVVAKRLSVYSGKKRVASGSSVRVPIGRYREAVTVKYHAYKFVTRRKTVTTKTRHPGGYPNDTVCRVLTIDDAGNGVLNDGIGTALTATCANRSYPNQKVALDESQIANDGWYDDNGTPYSDLDAASVNMSAYTDDVEFAAYITTSSHVVKTTAKTWTAYHSFTTAKRTLTVKDGGYQRIYSGYANTDYGTDFYTSYFTVPTHWTLAYSYDCSDTDIDWGNWILDVHRQGDPSYDDTNLNNDISSGDTAGWDLTGSGTVRLHVFTECVWAIVVRWK